MTDDTPVAETIDAVKRDLAAVGWQQRAQTMLLTTGVLAFGFMLGVHFMAAHTFSALPPLWQAPEYAHLQSLYETVMQTGVIVAGGCLVAGVGLELRGRETNE